MLLSHDRSDDDCVCGKLKSVMNLTQYDVSLLHSCVIYAECELTCWYTQSAADQCHGVNCLIVYKCV